MENRSMANGTAVRGRTLAPLVLLALATGCATPQLSEIEPAPPSLLTDYRTATVAVSTQLAEAKELTAPLGEAILKRLESDQLFESVKIDGPSKAKGLLIEVHITDVHRVSPGMRVKYGTASGRNRVTTDVRLLDPAANALLGRLRIVGTSQLGAWHERNEPRVSMEGALNDVARRLGGYFEARR